MKISLNPISTLFRKPQISPYYFQLLDQVLELENQTKSLTDLEILEKVQLLKRSFSPNQSNINLIAESFSLTREVAWRKLQLKHFETQILGGLILNDGKIAEMKTGEGKTLVATLPASFQALSGKGVHIITVNDYLAKRDKEFLQNVYQSLGFQVGLIRENMGIQQRQYNYGCDITYTTNAEVGFDYLRDLMADSLETRVHRKFNYCLIDEVDSVLIDEAQTPLILSRPKPLVENKYLRALWVAKQLVPNRHFIAKTRTKQISITEEGYQCLTEIFHTTDLYDPKDPWLAFVENALRALIFFQKDQDYIVKENEIQIIDKFTGRIAKGRKWSDGLHQAIECKENVLITAESQTLNSITYPKFFSLYKKLSGMTGTAKSSEKEFKEFYGLDVIVVPTRKPIQRKDLPDEIFETKKAKFKAVIDKIIASYQIGRPVLVGTTTIEDSEIINETLKEIGMKNCQLLNAKPENSEFEADTIAQSGQLNGVTIATNMAGRGTDIILGGNSKYLMNDLTKEILWSILDQNSKQIRYYFNQDTPSPLFHQCRELLENYSSEQIKTYLNEVTDIESYVPKTPLDHKIYSLYKAMIDWYQPVKEAQKQLVCDLGGLLIIGTGRHESRRIDDQLRGRSGRQGDVGASQFFISLEDELPKRYDPNLFLPFLGKNAMEPFSGTERLALTKAFDNLQSRVEKYLYEVRKSNAPFQDIYEFHQKMYFTLRECILEYREPLNLLINLSSLNILYSQKYTGSLPIYPIKSVKTTIVNSKESILYLSALIAYQHSENYASLLPSYYFEASRSIILEGMDQKWTEFAERISLTRETIGLQAYAQRDPLIQYARFCAQDFTELIDESQALVIQSIENSMAINKTYLGT